MKFIIMSLIILSSCGSAKLAPSDERRINFIEKTNLSKDENYNKSLEYLSKNLGDSNYAIKVNDKTSGTIITRASVICNNLRQFGDTNEYSLKFNLTINSKNNKIRFLFEDLQIVDKVGNLVRWEYNQITDSSKIKKIESCLHPIKSGILNSLTSQEQW